MATLACCQRVSTWVICPIGPSMREDKIEAATKAPVVRSPLITIGAPTNTTTANTPICTTWLQESSALVRLRNANDALAVLCVYSFHCCKTRSEERRVGK